MIIIIIIITTITVIIIFLLYNAIIKKIKCFFQPVLSQFFENGWNKFSSYFNENWKINQHYFFFYVYKRGNQQREMSKYSNRPYICVSKHGQTNWYTRD